MKARFLIFLGILSLTVLPTAAGNVLRTLPEANAFMDDFTPRAEDFEVTGTVLNVFTGLKYSQIILSDEQGNRTEFFRLLDAAQPAPGDKIRAKGRAFMGKTLESFLALMDFEVLEHGPRTEPVFVKLPDLRGSAHHLMTVRTEGTAIDAVTDEMDFRYMIILLKEEGASVPVSVRVDQFGDVSKLIGARIRITGIYRRYVSGIRKVSWPNLQPAGPSDLEVITPPPEDPFSAKPLEKQLYFSTDDILQMSRRTVQGEVLATWGGRRVMVRIPDERIVNLELANGEKLPACGSMIVAVGQPETDLFRVNLSAARWKPSEGGSPVVTNETPVSAVTAVWNEGDRNAINGQNHGQLLTLTGIIRILPAPDDTDLRFIVDANGLQVPVDVTSNPGLLDNLSIDSKVQVTGRCLLLADTWKHGGVFPQAKGFALVPRSAKDLIVLSRPSWWTPGKLLILITLLALAFVGVEIWNLVQRHLAKMKIVERTRLAVELHDSLSQNLAGVAFQVAAGKNAIGDNPETARARIQASERMLQSCRTELRQCLFDLRSDMLEEADFSAAIRKALSQLKDATNVAIRFNARRADFPDPDAHAILSVIRELTANAIRHGHAASVKIAGCVENGNLLFSVTDDGCGFDPQNCAGMAEGHFGLSGVRDRLKRLQGTITFKSTPGKGAKATVRLPLPRK